MQDPRKKVLGERAAHGGNHAKPSPKDHGHLVNLQEGKRCKEQHQVREEKGGSRARTTKTGKVEGDLTRASNLDRADHFGPFHGSRRRKIKRMIFGSESLWIPAGGGGQRGERRVGEIAKEEKKVSNPGPTSMVVSWVGRFKARANLPGLVKLPCALQPTGMR